MVQDGRRNSLRGGRRCWKHLRPIIPPNDEENDGMKLVREIRRIVDTMYANPTLTMLLCQTVLVLAFLAVQATLLALIE
ncbi:MAG: hypothetical protein CL813_13400 [Confluentimicrobium sp.]|nr:hypothetical protein [Actibacterium sp.]OWU68235.1 hypothetical protein ATO2_12690 [Roseovarius sp. 22II1-1F6A]